MPKHIGKIIRDESNHLQSSSKIAEINWLANAFQPLVQIRQNALDLSPGWFFASLAAGRTVLGFNYL